MRGFFVCLLHITSKRTQHCVTQNLASTFPVSTLLPVARSLARSRSVRPTALPVLSPSLTRGCCCFSLALSLSIRARSCLRTKGRARSCVVLCCAVVGGGEEALPVRRELAFCMSVCRKGSYLCIGHMCYSVALLSSHGDPTHLVNYI
jgi:hypothetical protein